MDSFTMFSMCVFLVVGLNELTSYSGDKVIGFILVVLSSLLFLLQ